MRRAAFLALLALLLAPSFAPLALAAAELDIVDVRIFSMSGRELEWVSQTDPVRLSATVKNVGDEDYTGAVNVRFEVQAREGFHQFSDSTGTTRTIKPERTDDVALTWPGDPPRPLGTYDLVATLEVDVSRRFAATFLVSDAALPAGTLGERVLDHWWFFATFIGAFVLFAAVLRVRKT